MKLLNDVKVYIYVVLFPLLMLIEEGSRVFHTSIIPIIPICFVIIMGDEVLKVMLGKYFTRIKSRATDCMK